MQIEPSNVSGPAEHPSHSIDGASRGGLWPLWINQKPQSGNYLQLLNVVLYDYFPLLNRTEQNVYLCVRELANPHSTTARRWPNGVWVGEIAKRMRVRQNKVQDALAVLNRYQLIDWSGTAGGRGKYNTFYINPNPSPDPRPLREWGRKSPLRGIVPSGKAPREGLDHAVHGNRNRPATGVLPAETHPATSGYSPRADGKRTPEGETLSIRDQEPIQEVVGAAVGRPALCAITEAPTTTTTAPTTTTMTGKPTDEPAARPDDGLGSSPLACELKRFLRERPGAVTTALRETGIKPDSVALSSSRWSQGRIAALVPLAGGERQYCAITAKHLTRIRRERDPHARVRDEQFRIAIERWAADVAADPRRHPTPESLQTVLKRAVHTIQAELDERSRVAQLEAFEESGFWPAGVTKAEVLSNLKRTPEWYAWKDGAIVALLPVATQDGSSEPLWLPVTADYLRPFTYKHPGVDLDAELQRLAARMVEDPRNRKRPNQVWGTIQ